MPKVCSSSLQQHYIGWLGLRGDVHLALSPHSSDEPEELSECLCNVDNPINIGMGIIIIIIIITTTIVLLMCCIML